MSKPLITFQICHLYISLHFIYFPTDQLRKHGKSMSIIQKLLFFKIHLAYFDIYIYIYIQQDIFVVRSSMTLQSSQGDANTSGHSKGIALRFYAQKIFVARFKRSCLVDNIVSEIYDS